MTDDQIPELDVASIRPGFWRRLSVVWLVPVIALVVSLGVAWNNYAQRGQLIEIRFDNASGIEAGKTVVKFRDVAVGLVEKVNFTNDLSKVIVAARMDNSVMPYLDETAHFWVVQPKVSVRGISGLNTVLSGVYIEGTWDTKAGARQKVFTGDKEAPLVAGDQKGTRFQLRARNGSQLAAGAPLLHKGIQVGYIEEPKLSDTGDGVTVAAFVEAPFDKRITSETRFWDTSGFSFSFGAGGFALDFNSIASLVEGGIGFDTVVSGGTPVEPGYSFQIYDDETSARQSLFNTASENELKVSVLFNGSVSGLTAGSEVKFRGVKVGSVDDIGAIVVPGLKRNRVQLMAVLSLNPSRLGLPDTATADDALAFLQDYVANGLRARLATGSILTGSLIVELVEVSDAGPAALDMQAKPFPRLPSAAPAVSNLDATAQGVMNRINALPIEDVMTSAVDMMNSVTALMNDDATRKVPGAAVALLDDTRALVASDDVKAIPTELRGVVTDLRGIIDDLKKAETISKLVTAVEHAGQAAANIDTASAGFPEVVEQLKALGEKANSLQVEGLVASTTRAVDSIDALIATDGARALPATLNASLDEVRTFLAEVRKGGAIENVNAALGSAQAAADAIEKAAASLPELSDRVNALVGQAESAVGAYSDKSRFNAETLATLRDIQAAAEAVSALARTIQRNPNSLLMGR